MQKKRWLILAAVVAALVSLAVLVAACGGDDGEGEEPTATAGAQPTAPEGTPEATEPADGGAPTATQAAPDATEPANGGAETTIDASLTEFDIALSSATAAAGAVTFAVSNDGTIPHDLIVIKTDLDPASLPYDDSAFAADLSGLNVIGTMDPLDVGQAAELAVELDAGAYVLICNIATHYEAGTYVAFTVQ